MGAFKGVLQYQRASCPCLTSITIFSCQCSHVISRTVSPFPLVRGDQYRAIPCFSKKQARHSTVGLFAIQFDNHTVSPSQNSTTCHTSRIRGRNSLLVPPAVITGIVEALQHSWPQLSWLLFFLCCATHSSGAHSPAHSVSIQKYLDAASLECSSSLYSVSGQQLRAILHAVPCMGSHTEFLLDECLCSF